MIRFINDQSQGWKELRALGTQTGLDSEEKLAAAVVDGWKRALDFLRGDPRKMAPTVNDLKLTHEFLFSEVLKSAGEFRQDAKPTQLLVNTHERAQELLLEKSPQKQISQIARYHAELMKERPFEDIPGKGLVNRMVAAVVMEAQLEHCFGHGIRREIDIGRLEKALDQAFTEGSRVSRPGTERKALEGMVREMAGSQANVLKMDIFRRNRGHGHDF